VFFVLCCFGCVVVMVCLVVVLVRLSGGEVLVECLLCEGVRYVFGIPGDRFTPFLDAIYRIGEKLPRDCHAGNTSNTPA